MDIGIQVNELVPPLKSIFRQSNHNIRGCRFSQRGIGLQKQLAKIGLTFCTEDNAPLIIGIELSDL